MGVTLTAGDLRKGLKLEIDGEPYLIVDFEFSKPGKGQALYRCRLRNMITGSQFDRTYRSGDKFISADLEEQEMQFLYRQGDGFHFMNTANYEQLELTLQQVGDATNYLTENLVVSMLLFQGRPMWDQSSQFRGTPSCQGRSLGQRRHGGRLHQTRYNADGLCPPGSPLH